MTICAIRLERHDLLKVRHNFLQRRRSRFSFSCPRRRSVYRQTRHQVQEQSGAYVQRRRLTQKMTNVKVSFQTKARFKIFCEVGKQFVFSFKNLVISGLIFFNFRSFQTILQQLNVKNDPFSVGIRTHDLLSRSLHP